MALLPIKSPKNLSQLPSIYSLSFKTLNGQVRLFSEFEGRKILIVNVASKCGFTPQYKALEQLHQTYGNQLVVLGFPCNQFANQEPGDAEEIQQFCQVNYGVSFLLGEKLNVKGDDQHPIYQWLTDKNKNGVKNSSVKWNFQKYLLDEHGRFVDYFFSITSPTSEKIIKLL